MSLIWLMLVLLIAKHITAENSKYDKTFPECGSGSVDQVTKV